MPAERSRSHPPFQPEAWWLTLFERCDVQYLVLDPQADQRLIRYVRTQPGWTLDYSDPQGVLFVRSDLALAP